MVNVKDQGKRCGLRETINVLQAGVACLGKGNAIIYVRKKKGIDEVSHCDL